MTNTSFIKRLSDYKYDLVALSYHIGYIYALKNSIFISKWLPVTCNVIPFHLDKKISANFPIMNIDDSIQLL